MSILKKLLIGVLALGLTFLFVPKKQALAEMTYDQGCVPTGAWIQVVGHPGGVWQTFTPTQNRLSRVGLWMEGTGTGDVSLRVLHGDTLLGSAVRNEPNGYALIYFDFNDLELVPGDGSYRLWASAYVGNISLYWHYKTGCYSGGAAYLDGAEKDFDYGFATFGWTYTPSEEPNPPGDEKQPSQPSVDSGTTQGTGQAPASVTSSAIKSPAALAAEDVANDQGGSIKLSWTASTSTNIDGYKIFRSEQEKDGFKNILKAEKGTVSAADTGAETDKTYYYFVRAYKSNSESASSNTVNAVSKDNLAPAKPKNFRITNTESASTTFGWEANIEEDLAGYTLLVVDASKKEETIAENIEIKKEDKSYKLVKAEHPGLKPDANYSYFLQAKDIHNNFSEKAELAKSGNASVASEGIGIDDILTWYNTGGLIIVILLLYLWYRIRKRQKQGQKPIDFLKWERGEK